MMERRFAKARATLSVNGIGVDQVDGKNAGWVGGFWSGGHQLNN